MAKSIEKRAFSGVVWGGVSFGLTFVQNIVLVPIFLSYWGAEMYGLWIALMAAYTMIQRIDFGHQVYISFELNKLWVANRNKFTQVLGSAVSVALFLGVLEILVIISFWKFGLLGPLFGLDETEITRQGLHFALMAHMLEWLLIGNVGGVLVKLYTTFGNYDTSQRINILYRTITVIVIAIAAYNKFAILNTSITLVAVLIGFGIGQLTYFRYKYPFLYPWWQGANLKLGINNVVRSVPLTVSNLIDQFNITGISLLISSNLGLALIPAFTTLRSLTSTVKQATGLVLNPIVPDLARYYVERDFNRITQVLRANLFVSGFPANMLFFALMPFVAWIYQTWTAGKLEFNMLLFHLLALSALLMNLGSGLTGLVNAINNPKVITYITIAKLAAPAFALLTIRQLELYSVAVGVLLADILGTVIIPLSVVNKFYKENNQKFDFQIIWLGLMPILFIAFSFAAQIWLPTNLFYFVYFFTLGVNIFYFWLQWKRLDASVRNRITGLLTSKIPFLRKK